MKPNKLTLTEDERRAVAGKPQPPFLLTDHWMGLLDGQPDDPLRRQAIPSTAEERRERGEQADPLTEGEHTVLPRLVRRYRDRALVIMTGRCALYCRHCFRRRLTGDDYGDISDDQATAIADWIAVHPEVKELLLSGGDPLMLTPRRLTDLIDVFRRSRPNILLRLATRIPVVDPQRVSKSLARSLGHRRPLWVVMQANHPRELSADTLAAVERLQREGLPVINQSVLLRGVNDHPDVLENLSRNLLAAGIKPYYLFQGDLAEGTAHFRVPLEDAQSLVANLRSRLSSLAMPLFAVDLPNGGGKTLLTPNNVLDRTGEGWRLRGSDGREALYPDPEDVEPQNFSDGGHLRWENINKKTLCDARVVRVKNIERRSADGRQASFIALEAPDWVTVIPQLPPDNGEQPRFLVVRQFRHGIEDLSLEFPAGVVDPHEEPMEAARRELLEETGYRADELIRIGAVSPNPAFMTNTTHTYLARGLTRAGKQSLDEHEILDAHIVDYSDLAHGIGTGPYASAITVQAWYFYLRARVHMGS